MGKLINASHCHHPHTMGDLGSSGEEGKLHDKEERKREEKTKIDIEEEKVAGKIIFGKGEASRTRGKNEKNVRCRNDFREKDKKKKSWTG